MQKIRNWGSKVALFCVPELQKCCSWGAEIAIFYVDLYSAIAKDLQLRYDKNGEKRECPPRHNSPYLSRLSVTSPPT
jgi:hypothetical protein